jgi:hypothetical protein
MHVRDVGRFNSVTEAVLDPNHDIVEQVFSEPYLGESYQQRERGHELNQTDTLSEGNVTFRWRDSAHGNKKRFMTLRVEE